MSARIGVVGIGWWAAQTHIPTVQASEAAEVVAICDLDAERLRIAGDHFGIAARYEDMHTMLVEERLDGVMIATPHVAHTAPAIAALEAGCHVLVEKPMATDPGDARAIADAAKSAGREVLVPTGLNFEDHSLVARDWVAKGRIGAVRHVVCQMGSPLHDLMAGQPMVDTEGHLFRPPPGTWADPQNAGGYAWGQMSHSLAWMHFVSGLTLETIFAMSGASDAGVDYYDAATARAVNGATVVLSGASTVPKHKGMHTDVRIFGTEGVLVFDNQQAKVELWRLDGEDDTYVAEGRPEYDGALPVQVFARLCAGEDVVNASDAECGAAVTAIIAALHRSVSSGVVEGV